MRLSAILCLGLAAATAACSSSSGSGAGSSTQGPTDQGSNVTADTTWADGRVISESVTIAAGTTVTIAAGASIQVVAGATITVLGTLKSAGGTPAKIGASTNESWGGIIVGSGGTLALDGVDLDSVNDAIDVQGGAKSAKYDHGTISNAMVPFTVEAQAELSTSHAIVKFAGGISQVQGSFIASYLDYDSNGHDGIEATSDAAKISVEDSTLHGAGGDADMFVSYKGADTIHVAYSAITEVHCAFHLERITNLDVSHVTAQGDANGFMMYGSLTQGTRTVRDSNFVDSKEWGFQEEDTSVNGPITVDNCYFHGNALGDVHLRPSSAVTVTNKAAAMIPGAAPR